MHVGVTCEYGGYDVLQCTVLGWLGSTEGKVLEQAVS